jgi:hypothetical protein
VAGLNLRQFWKYENLFIPIMVVPMFHLRSLIIVSLALVFAPAAALPVKAAGNPEAAKGLVVEHCSDCNAVPGYSAQGLPTVEVPSFQAIADAPDTYTEQRLRKFLINHIGRWSSSTCRPATSIISSLI